MKIGPEIPVSGMPGVTQHKQFGLEDLMDACEESWVRKVDFCFNPAQRLYTELTAAFGGNPENIRAFVPTGMTVLGWSSPGEDIA